VVYLPQEHSGEELQSRRGGLMKISIVSPGDDIPRLDVVDDKGNVLCEVVYDDHIDVVMHTVAAAVCEAVGVEFEGLVGY
jgi:hypothetical protein